MACKLQIIIFEDDDVLFEFYLAELQEAGFDVHGFNNTEDIVNRLKQFYCRPTIVLCDFYIDPQKPTEFLQHLRSHHLNMPFVVISSEPFTTMANLLALYGLHGYFQKSANMISLMQVLIEHLRNLQPLATTLFDQYKINDTSIACSI